MKPHSTAGPMLAISVGSLINLGGTTATSGTDITGQAGFGIGTKGS